MIIIFTPKAAFHPESGHYLGRSPWTPVLSAHKDRLPDQVLDRDRDPGERSHRHTLHLDGANALHGQRIEYIGRSCVSRTRAAWETWRYSGSRADLGVAESLTSTFSGPSWPWPCHFGILLLALAVRPSGLFGR